MSTYWLVFSYVGVVFDLTAHEYSNYRLSVNDVRHWEEKYGQIPDQVCSDEPFQDFDERSKTNTYRRLWTPILSYLRCTARKFRSTTLGTRKHEKVTAEVLWSLSHCSSSLLPSSYHIDARHSTIKQCSPFDNYWPLKKGARPRLWLCFPFLKAFLPISNEMKLHCMWACPILGNHSPLHWTKQILLVECHQVLWIRNCGSRREEGRHQANMAR